MLAQENDLYGDSTAQHCQQPTHTEIYCSLTDSSSCALICLFLLLVESMLRVCLVWWLLLVLFFLLSVFEIKAVKVRKEKL